MHNNHTEMRFLKLGLVLTFFAITLTTFAQSGMSDEQVMQFVIAQNEKGTPRTQIASMLLQQGVTMEQINRIKAQYEKQQSGNVLGAIDLTGEGKTRQRKNNGEQIRNFQKKKAEDKNAKLRSKEEREEELANAFDFMLPEDTLSYLIEDTEEKEEKRIKVFGRDIFNQKNLSFEPNMNIATPENYSLGAGDVVFIDIWGASQRSISTEVTPDGTINVPDYGPIHIGGLSITDANKRLRSTLGSRYANSEVKLTLGQTRTITINVMGEVVAPGTYTVSAFATVFHALYHAGGINDIGTLRNIEVWRKGKKIASVDIYDYILNGKLSGNIRLNSDDIIIVGSYDCLVCAAGKVKRPMYYEMKETESVATLIRYAGGFTGDAYKDNVRLIRKSGGEFSIYSLNETEMSSFNLMDSDSLTVDSTLNRYKNLAEVKGAVFRPGMYQMDGSISTVRSLVEAAGGLVENALTTRAVMHRRRADRTLEVVSVDIAGIMERRVADITLRNEDVLFIPSLEDINNEQTLSILGEVVNPGIYQYAANTTLEDLVLQAGGLKDAASVVKVDVARRIRDQHATKSSDEVAKTFSFALKEGFVINGTPGFVLEPFDEVFVRRSPGYVEQEHVTIEGEITFSGTYTLSKKNQRLSDLVKAAGGITAEAYPKGARLERKLTEIEKEKRKQMIKLISTVDTLDYSKLEMGDTRYVGINLDKALENPGSEWDVVLEEGDRLFIPQYNNTVTINGEVYYPNTVAYSSGKKLSHYINQAGGFTQKASKKRAFVVNMNGTISRVKKARDIQPGCEILVPAKIKRNRMTFAEIMSLGSITASLGMVVATLLK